MTVEPTKQDKIEAAKQAIEVTEAMQAISDDEVQLSLNEEQQTLDSTESEEEAQNLRDAAILAKKSKVATQRAKTAVNKSVPADKLFQRPSFGHVSAKAFYHTRDAYRFLLGAIHAHPSMTINARLQAIEYRLGVLPMIFYQANYSLKLAKSASNSQGGDDK